MLAFTAGASSIPTLPDAIPPSHSTVKWWLDSQNIDGHKNATVAQGSIPATAVNLGGAGGTFGKLGSPKATYNGRFWSLTLAGTDGMQTGAIPAVNGVFKIAVLVKRTTNATQYYCDGLSVGNRAQILSNLNTSVQIVTSSGFATASPDTSGQYNLIVCTFAGNSSVITVNLPKDDSNSGTGTTATQPLTGITFGSARDGSQGTVGEFVEGIVWVGNTVADLPTDRQVGDYFADKVSPGWPKPALWQLQQRSYLTTPLASVVGGWKVSMFGDSITSNYTWYDGLVASINSVVSTPITTVNNGLFGDTLGGMLARITDVTGQVPKPNATFLEVGLNDFTGAISGGVVGGTDLLTFINTGQTLINQLKAAGVAIPMWVGPFSRNEQVPDLTTPQLRQYDYAINYLCYVNKIAHINVLDPRLNWDAANNLPAPGNIHDPGPLGQTLYTIDGTHPNAAGKSAMSATAFARCSLSG